SDPYQWALTQNGLIRSTDQLIVSEHYQVATGPDADDGRHVVVVWGAGDHHDAVVLHDSEFERTTPPIVIWHYTPPRNGQQSTGAGDMLLRWQHKVDAGNARVTEVIELLGKADAIGDETMFKHVVHPSVNLIPVIASSFGD